MSDEEVESVNISTPSTPYSHSHSKPVVASHAVSISTASVGALAEPVIATAETAPATSATTSTPASATVHVPAVQRHCLQPAGQVLVRLNNQLDQVLHEVAVLVVEEGGGQAKVTHPPSSADSEKRKICGSLQKKELSFAPQVFQFKRSVAYRFIHFMKQQTENVESENARQT